MVGGRALVVWLSASTVAYHADRPEEMRIETEKRQQQPEHKPACHSGAAERTGAERMTNDQVTLERDRYDQPHRVVADLNADVNQPTAILL